MPDPKTPHRAARLLLAAALVFPLPAVAGPEGRWMTGDELFAQAVQLFRAGRFPEAYGRFVALADAGHAKAALQALWMCENGPTIFGSHWDCAPHQVAAWTDVAHVPTRGLARAGGTSSEAGHGKRR